MGENESIYDSIQTDVQSFGATNIFEYMKLHAEWTKEDADAAIDARRKWAQGQRSNPKFSDESVWFIKNASQIKDILQAPAKYQQYLANKKLDVEVGKFVDHYSNLGVSPSSSISEIESAHRDRYREARTLLERETASRTYKQLDEAWSILSDPQLRSVYDVEHRKNTGLGAEWDQDHGNERRAEGLLGPHSKQNSHAPFEDSGQESLRRRIQTSPDYKFNKNYLTLSIGEAPTTVDLEVVKSGAGRQPARLYTDSKWLQVSPSHLDPAASVQTVQLTTSPRLMESSRELAKLTLETSDRKKTSVNILGKRKRFSRTFLRFLIVIFIIFSARIFLTYKESQSLALPTELELRVTPTPDSIFIDGVAVAPNILSIFSDIPHDTPVLIVVEKQGFETYQQPVIVGEGNSETVEIHLQRIED